jgi:trimeric autotransporter adhesin
MQKRYTLVVISAVLFVVAGFFTWQRFSPATEKEIAREYEGKLSKQDRIDLAMQQEFEWTKDPALNRIPKERLIHAMRIRDEKLARMANTRAVGGLSWEERGPSNVGGRTRAICYDLSDAVNGYKKVWAGSVSGGLWYTNDITQPTPQWIKVNDFMDNLAITTIAQNPANTQELYAGTGEGWFNIDAVQGLGIWKSSDGGATWAQLPSTTGSSFLFIQKIVITSTGVVYACTRGNGLYQSTDGGANFNKVLGAGVNG